MTLILIESMKLRFTEETKPDYFEPKVGEEENGKPGQPAKPQWGAMPGSGVLLPDRINIGPKVPVGSVPCLKTNRVRLGVQSTDRSSGEGGLNPGVAGVDPKPLCKV